MICIRAQKSPIVKGSRFQLDTNSALNLDLRSSNVSYVRTYVCEGGLFTRRLFISLSKASDFMQLLITDSVF